MIQDIQNWWLRCFCVISIEKAKELGLNFLCNIYGDTINRINCRSLFTDKKGIIYRVDSLIKDTDGTYYPRVNFQKVLGFNLKGGC